ncbi:hypothetical protein [Nonomuraea sp. NPDC049028]|uniref:hypothetical protein n=1 Tax=Nonomuraea sp. NPDC049028 TaxID=3364348 RepID=UPI003711164E
MPEFEPLREEEPVQVGVYRLIGRLSPDVFVGTPNPAGTDESPPPSSSESEFEPSSPSQFESAPPPSGAELVVVKLLHPEIDQERFLRLINFGIGRAMAGTASATTRKVDVPAFTAPERLGGAAAEPPGRPVLVGGDVGVGGVRPLALRRRLYGGHGQPDHQRRARPARPRGPARSRGGRLSKDPASRPTSAGGDVELRTADKPGDTLDARWKM